MPNFFVITKWHATTFRVEKSNPFPIQELADEFIEENIGKFPDAFIVVDPPGQASDLIVDPVTKTVTLDILPPVKPTVISYDDFEARFTVAEWNKATNWLYEVIPTTGLPKRPKMLQGYNRVIARNSVDLLDPKTNTFLNVMVTGGVITAARKTTILTP